jgi:hypothetical protein
VAPGIKKRNDHTSGRIDPAQIRTLPKIAPVTCQRQIIDVVQSPVLFRNNVFDVMSEFAVILTEQTIFARVRRTMPNEVARDRVHVTS